MDTFQNTFNSTRSTSVSSSTISSETLKQKSHWRVFKDTVNEYASSSSAHGIAYIFDNALKAFDRILWILAVCLGIGFAIILSLKAWIDWKDSPVLTSVSSTGLPIQNIDFPAITICSQGLIKVIIKHI